MLSGGSCFSLTPTPRPWKDTDILICFCGDEVLIAPEGSAVLPSCSQLMPYLASAPVLLLEASEKSVYFADLSAPPALPGDSGLVLRPASVFRSMAQEEAYILTTAWHLAQWYRRNKRCGSCTGAMQPSQTERALICQDCGQTLYPSPSPAVAVAIISGERLLMARNIQATFRHFSLIAGYVEAGESLEETVHREVMEEVGLKVKNLRYLGSQPWGWSQSLMVGFQAELMGSDAITLQESELSEARWFRRDEIEKEAAPISLSFDIIQRFRRGEI